MGYFIKKLLVPSKPPRNVSLIIVCQEQYESFSKSFTFRNDDKGKLKCKARLTKLLDSVYMDLDSDADGKIEDDNGNMVYMKPEYARASYDYDMVWDDLIRTGTTETVHMPNGNVNIFLS
jgi:hypothetical protein